MIMNHRKFSHLNSGWIETLKQFFSFWGFILNHIVEVILVFCEVCLLAVINIGPIGCYLPHCPLNSYSKLHLQFKCKDPQGSRFMVCTFAFNQLCWKGLLLQTDKERSHSQASWLSMKHRQGSNSLTSCLVHACVCCACVSTMCFSVCMCVSALLEFFLRSNN